MFEFLENKSADNFTVRNFRVLQKKKKKIVIFQAVDYSSQNHHSLQNLCPLVIQPFKNIVSAIIMF